MIIIVHHCAPQIKIFFSYMVPEVLLTCPRLASDSRDPKHREMGKDGYGKFYEIEQRFFRLV